MPVLTEETMVTLNALKVDCFFQNSFDNSSTLNACSCQGGCTGACASSCHASCSGKCEGACALGCYGGD